MYRYVWVVYRTDCFEPMGVFSTAENAYQFIVDYAISHFKSFEILKKQFLDALQKTYKDDNTDFCGFCTTSFESSYTVYATRYELDTQW